METAQTIGAILRAARESKEISIATAAIKTNLSTSILEKLESNRFAEIGAAVFTRGYLLNYSRFLGLDVELMADEFSRLNLKDAEIRLNSANIASQSRSFKRHHLKTWLMVIPILALAIVVLSQVFNPNSWLITQFKQAFNHERSQLTETGNPTSPENQITVQIATEVNTPIVETNHSALPETIPSLTSLSDENINENIVLTSTDSVGENMGIAVEREISSTTPTFPTEISPVVNSSAVGGGSSSAGLQLKFSGESWVEVRNKERRIVVSKIYQAGGVIEASLEDAPYELSIGRPEMVSLMINGKDVDLAQYRVGKTRRFKVVP